MKMTIEQTATALLKTIRGTRMTAVDYTTAVKTAALHKDKTVLKSVTASVQLFGSVKDYEVYVRQVLRSAGRIAENGEPRTEYTTGKHWHQHIDGEPFSIVEHPATHKRYILCIYNRVIRSEYTIDGLPASKAEVAELCTPSAKKLMLEDNSIVYNKQNDLLHTVICRTIGMDSLRAMR